MYDAKEKENQLEDTNYLTSGYCISDRSYFDRVQNRRLVDIKSSYVPKECLFNDFNLE